MNYTVCSQKNLVMWGYLFQAKLMQTPQVFFCPTERSYPVHMYNTAENPWPPPAGLDPPVTGTVRAGYGFRPSIGTGPYQDFSWNATGSVVTTPRGQPPGWGVNLKSAVTGQPMSMARLSKLKSKAIITDIFSGP